MSSALTADQAKLVERTLGEVDSIARRLRRRLSHVPEEDLKSAGREALVRAASRYDPATGVPFAAYAHYRIQGAMIDAARSADAPARRASRAAKELQRCQDVLQDAHARDTGQVDALRERVAAARDVVRRTAAALELSRRRPVDPEEVGAEASSPETAAIREQLKARLANVLGGLEPKDRELVAQLYDQDRSMAELAEELGVSRSTVSRRHARLLDKLAAAMRSTA